MSCGWVFQGVHGGEINGINESGMEIFRGAPYKSLAREVCQNSLDARNNLNAPVVVDFQMFDIDANDFPNKAAFINALSSIEHFYKNRPIRKVKDFLARANAIFQNRTIRCLRISDFNTEGLTGSASEDNHLSVWSTLVKSAGVSPKGKTEGGSFGIGKSAPFTCSELRTVFYSTLDNEGVKASQGVAKLISFVKEDGSIATGRGYFCDPKTNAPLYELAKLDENYVRTECGTDIFILGFENSESWKDEVVKSVIDGFMLAIVEKHLVVKIGEEIINDSTLPNYLEKYSEDIPHTKNYYEAYTSPSHTFDASPIEYLDGVELRVLVKKGLHSKVAYFRNSGMKIQDRGYVSQFIPFAAVLALRGKDINKTFKDMESVSHDKWEPQRVDGENNKKIAKMRLNSLYSFVKTTICALETDLNASEIDAEGVGEYLPDDVGSDEKKRPEDMQESVVDKIKTFEIDVVKKTPKTGGVQGEEETSGTTEEDAFGEPDDDIEEDNGHLPQGRPNTTSGGVGTPARLKENPAAALEMRKLVKVKPIYVRLFCTDRQTGKYMLTFVPDRAITDGYIDLQISGEQSNTSPTIIDAHMTNDRSKLLLCQNSKILIKDISEKEKIKLSFSLDFTEYCSLEVSVCEYKI